MAEGFTSAVERTAKKSIWGVANTRPVPGGMAENEGCSGGVAQGGLGDCAELGGFAVSGGSRGTPGSWWGPTQPVSNQGANLVEEAEVKATRASFLFSSSFAFAAVCFVAAVAGVAEGAGTANTQVESRTDLASAKVPALSPKFDPALVQMIEQIKTGVSEEEIRSGQMQLPFGRTLDFSRLKRILNLPSDRLVEAMEAEGLKIYRVPNSHSKNPVFRKARIVTKDMLATGEFEDTIYRTEATAGITQGTVQGAQAKKLERRDAGFFVAKESPELGKWGPFVVVLESASTYTLIHEYVHFLFSQQQTAAVRQRRATLWRYNYQSFRSLTFNASAVQNYPERTSKAHRDSVIENLHEYARLNAEHVAFVATEEVAIESLLAHLISPGSQHYSVRRRIEGLEYAYRNWFRAVFGFEQLLILSENLLYAFGQKAGIVATPASQRDEILESIHQYRNEFQPIVEEFREESNRLKARLGEAATPRLLQWLRAIEQAEG